MNRSQFTVSSILLLVSLEAMAAAPGSHRTILFTGKELARSCNSENYEARNDAWQNCLLIVKAVNNGMILGADRVIHSKYFANSLLPSSAATTLESYLSNCLPNGVTLDQMGVVVSNYLKNHLNRLDDDAALTVANAFNSAWPCKSDMRK